MCLSHAQSIQIALNGGMCCAKNERMTNDSAAVSGLPAQREITETSSLATTKL